MRPYQSLQLRAKCHPCFISNNARFNRCTADMMLPTVLILGVLMVAGTAAQFNSSLVVDSCTQSSLVMTLTDGAESGIIYIQGQSAACKQATFAAATQHTFDFSSCGIAWESSFKVVVQKKALYQTGDDKQIPIMCIADVADLTVSNNVNAADKDDDAGQNKTVKPTATMALYKDGVSVAGATVKLTDQLTMILQLDADYIQDFDLKAKDCTASTINIVTGSCADDIELFPQFTHTAQGILSAGFGAFRTTDLNGGSVGMIFSCTLQVCLGSCTAETCSDGSSGWGRKKRSIQKRQAEGNNGIEDINVGASISITTDQVVITAPEDHADVCMNQGAFIAIVIMLVAGLITSTVVAIFMFRKLQEKSGILNKLHGNHMTSISVPVA